MANGKLVVNAKNQIRVRFTNAKNVEVEMAVPDAELAASLRAVPPKELNGRDVELDVEKGQPRKVRPVGEAFAAPRSQPPAGGQRREEQGGRRPQGERRPQPQGQRQPINQGPKPAFHNPYNFVPTPPRKVEHPELGDVHEIETMGGLLTHLLGVVPAQGESAAFRGLKLIAQITDERRVRELRVEKIKPATWL